MNLRKLGIGVLVAFALFYAITNPLDAAGIVHTTWSGVVSFFTALADGGRR
jgi:hypothetical protein